MPLIVGFIVTPVGALTATLTFALVILIAHDAFGSWVFTIDTASTILIVALTYGVIFATPVTLVALPIAYSNLRRRSALTLARLAAAGALFAILLIWGIIAAFEIHDNRFDFFSRKSLYFTFIATVTGLVVGLTFAYIMRWKRPMDWPAMSRPTTKQAEATR